MTDKLTKLKPGALVKLLNSFPDLGEVLNVRTLHRYRQKAGLRISDDDGKTVNLFKLGAWLFDERHAPVNEVQSQPNDYNAKREAARKRSVDASLSGRDIGDLPPVVNPQRRERALGELKFFLETYFPETFYMDWAEDHLDLIDELTEIIINGGKKAFAMPRGEGKTQISDRSGLWGVIAGHRRLMPLVGATDAAALEMMETIKTELEGNELLLEDFPEICYPIRKLEGITNRCKGQLYKGKNTRITWDPARISLPIIPGSKASGGKITVSGILGRIRGLAWTEFGGGTIRPDIVIIDDPQTDEVARNPDTVKKIIKVINKTIKGLAGPDIKLSMIMPCTIIEPDDVAAQLLDREKSPDWNGTRTQMMTAFPENEDLWEEYDQIRRDSLKEHGDIRLATEFYKNNREALDKGAAVSWDKRFVIGEISAIQHAMNLKLEDEASFFSEYQNDPQPDDLLDEGQITVAQVKSKLNNLKRRTPPLDTDRVTAFIDVHAKLLYYNVTAWGENFTSGIIDYDVYPEQNRREFTLKNSRITLKHKHPGTGEEGAIYAGLEALTDKLFSQEWVREDGAILHLEKCAIDANWGEMTNVVYQFCRQSKYAAMLIPTHGQGITASMKPYDEYSKRPGDRIGHNWRMPSLRKKKRLARYITYDTNYWKSFVRSRLNAAMGDKGCLSIFGSKPDYHTNFAENCTAEYFTVTAGRGRKVDEWKMRPNHYDNHWFDCLVGSAVLASFLGLELYGVTDTVKKRSSRKTPAYEAVNIPEQAEQQPEQQSRRSPGGRSWSQIQKDKRKNR